ncbi:hypothetical protein RUM44_008766 [Polyplax serrata]|uniref:VWFC domain-containing protein n=1 Tax=Polyplax serrata TaxID=468196 RepID=A0ABR1B9G0_POLSC
MTSPVLQVRFQGRFLLRVTRTLAVNLQTVHPEFILARCRDVTYLVSLLHFTGVRTKSRYPNGCYYNFEHYNEGERIITNEPCLNCTCRNRIFMCYLRVCPFTKEIGQNCTIEKVPGQCCPIITCPEVPVHLLASSTTEHSGGNKVPGAYHGYKGTAVGQLDNNGCIIDGDFYPNGAQVPGSPEKPCELCYCIRNKTACIMQECALHVDGCRPVYEDGQCFPVRYQCDDSPYEDEPTTTFRPPPTPGLVLTTTSADPLECTYNNEIFADGSRIGTEDPCEHCYCLKGKIACAVQECGAPLEKEGQNCTALPPAPGKCCPDSYQCDDVIIKAPETNILKKDEKYPPKQFGTHDITLPSQSINPSTEGFLSENKYGQSTTESVDVHDKNTQQPGDASLTQKGSHPSDTTQKPDNTVTESNVPLEPSNEVDPSKQTTHYPLDPPNGDRIIFPDTPIKGQVFVKPNKEQETTENAHGGSQYSQPYEKEPTSLTHSPLQETNTMDKNNSQPESDSLTYNGNELPPKHTKDTDAPNKQDPLLDKLHNIIQDVQAQVNDGNTSSIPEDTAYGTTNQSQTGHFTERPEILSHTQHSSQETQTIPEIQTEKPTKTNYPHQQTDTNIINKIHGIINGIYSQVTSTISPVKHESHNNMSYTKHGQKPGDSKYPHGTEEYPEGATGRPDDRYPEGATGRPDDKYPDGQQPVDEFGRPIDKDQHPEKYKPGYKPGQKPGYSKYPHGTEEYPEGATGRPDEKYPDSQQPVDEFGRPIDKDQHPEKYKPGQKPDDSKYPHGTDKYPEGATGRPDEKYPDGQQPVDEFGRPIDKDQHPEKYKPGQKPGDSKYPHGTEEYPEGTTGRPDDRYPEGATGRPDDKYPNGQQPVDEFGRPIDKDQHPEKYKPGYKPGQKPGDSKYPHGTEEYPEGATGRPDEKYPDGQQPLDEFGRPIDKDQHPEKYKPDDSKYPHGTEEYPEGATGRPDDRYPEGATLRPHEKYPDGQPPVDEIGRPIDKDQHPEKYKPGHKPGQQPGDSKYPHGTEEYPEGPTGRPDEKYPDGQPPVDEFGRPIDKDQHPEKYKPGYKPGQKPDDSKYPHGTEEYPEGATGRPDDRYPEGATGRPDDKYPEGQQPVDEIGRPIDKDQHPEKYKPGYKPGQKPDDSKYPHGTEQYPVGATGRPDDKYPDGQQPVDEFGRPIEKDQHPEKYKPGDSKYPHGTEEYPEGATGRPDEKYPDGQPPVDEFGRPIDKDQHPEKYKPGYKPGQKPDDSKYPHGTEEYPEGATGRPDEKYPDGQPPVDEFGRPIDKDQHPEKYKPGYKPGQKPDDSKYPHGTEEYPEGAATGRPDEKYPDGQPHVDEFGRPIDKDQYPEKYKPGYKPGQKPGDSKYPHGTEEYPEGATGRPDEKYPDGQQPVDEFGRPIDKDQYPEKYKPGYKPGQQPGDSKYPHGTEEYPEGATGRPDEKYPNGQQSVDEFGRPIDKDQHPEKYKPGYKPGQQPGDSKYPHGTEEYPEGATGRPDEKYPDGQQPLDEFGRPIDKDQHPEKYKPGYKPGQKPDDSKYPHGTEEYPEGATGRPDDRYPEGATGRPDDKYPDGQQPVDEIGRPIDKDQHPEKYKPGYKPGQKPDDSKYPHGTEQYPEGATGRPDDKYPDGQQPVDEFGRPIEKDQHPEKYKPGYKPGQKPGDSKYPHGTEEYPEGATERPDEKYPDGQPHVDEFGRPIDKDQHPEKYKPGYKPGQKPGDSKYPHGTEEYPEGATGRPDEKYPDGQPHVDEFGRPIDKDQHPEKYKPGYKPGQKPDDSKYPHSTEEYPEGATGRPDEKYPDGQPHLDEFGRPIDKDQYPEKYKPGYKPGQKPGDSKYPHGTEEYPEGATGRPDEKYPDGQQPVDEFGRPIDKDQYPEKYKPGYKPGQKPGDSKYPHGTEEYPEGATGRPDDRYPEGATGRPDEKYPDGQQPVDEFGKPIDKDQHPEKYKPGQKPGDSKFPHGTEEYPEGATGRPDDRYPEGATLRPHEKYPDGQEPVDEFGRPIDKDQHPEKYKPGYKPGQKPGDSKYPHGTEEYPEGATGRPDDRYPEGATGRPDDKYPDGQQPVDEFGKPVDKDQHPEKYKPGQKPGDSKYPHGTQEYPEGATGRPDEKYPEGATSYQPTLVPDHGQQPDHEKDTLLPHDNKRPTNDILSQIHGIVQDLYNRVTTTIMPQKEYESTTTSVESYEPNKKTNLTNNDNTSVVSIGTQETHPDGQQPVDEFGRPIEKDQHPEKYKPGYKPGQKPDDSKYPHGTEEYPEGPTGRPDEKYPDGQQPVDEFGRPIDKDQHPEKYKPGYKPGQKPGDSKYPHGTEEYPEGATGRPDDRYPEGATGRPDDKYPDGQQPVDEIGRPIDKDQHPEKYKPGYKPGQKPDDSKYPHGTEEYPEGATGRPDDRYPEGATGRPDDKYPDGQQPDQHPEKYKPGYKPGQKPDDSKYPHGTEQYPEGATGRPDDKYPDGQQPVDEFGRPIEKDQHHEKYKPGYKPGQKPGDSKYPHGTEEYPEGPTGRPDEKYPDGQPPVDELGRPIEKDQHPEKYKPGYKPGQKPGDSKYPHGTEEYPEGATGRPDDRYPEGATGRPDDKYPDGQQPVDEFGRPIDKDQHPEKYKPGHKPGQKPDDSKYPHGTEEYPEGPTGRPDEKYPDGQPPVDELGRPIEKDQHPEKYKPGYKPGQKPGDSKYPHGTEEYPEGATGRPDDRYPEGATGRPDDKYPDGQQPVDEFGRPIDKDQHPEKYKPGYKPGQKPGDSKYPHGTEEYPEGATGRPDDRYPEGATGRPDDKYPDGQQPVDEIGRPIDKDQHPEKYKPGYKPGQKPDDSKYPHGTEEYPEGATGRPDDRYPEGATGRPDDKYPDGQQPVDEFGRPIDKDQHPEKYKPGYQPGQKPDDSKYPHGTEEYPEGATGRPDDKYPDGQQPVDEFGRPIEKDQHPEKYKPGYKPGQKPGDSKYPHGTEEYPEGPTGRPDEKYPDGQEPVDEFGRPIEKDQHPEKYKPGYKPGQKPGDSKYPHGTEEYPEGATGRPDDRYPEGATGRPDEKYPDGQEPVDEFGKPIDKDQHPEKYKPGYKPGQKPDDSKYPHGTDEYPEGATGRPDEKYPDGQPPVDEFGRPIEKDQHPEKYKPGYKPGQKPDDSKYPHGTEQYPEGATGRPDDKYPDGQQPVDEIGRPIDKDQHPEKYKPGYKPGQKPDDSKYPHGTEEYPEGPTGRPDEKYPDGQQPVDEFGRPIDKDQHPEKYKPGYKPGQKPGDSKYPHGTEEYPEGATGRPDDRYPEGATGRPDEKYPDGQQPVDEFGRPIDKDQHPEKYKPGYKPGQKPGDSKYPHGTEEYPEGATGRPDDRYPEGATGRPDEKYPDGQQPVDEFGRPIDKDQHPEKYKPGYKPGQKPGDSKYPHGTEEYPEGATGRPDEKYPDGQQPVDEFGRPIDKDQHPEKYKPGYKPGQKPGDSKYPHMELMTDTPKELLEDQMRNILMVNNLWMNLANQSTRINILKNTNRVTNLDRNQEILNIHMELKSTPKELLDDLMTDTPKELLEDQMRNILMVNNLWMNLADQSTRINILKNTNLVTNLDKNQVIPNIHMELKNTPKELQDDLMTDTPKVLLEDQMRNILMVNNLWMNLADQSTRINILKNTNLVTNLDKNQEILNIHMELKSTPKELLDDLMTDTPKELLEDQMRNILTVNNLWMNLADQFDKDQHPEKYKPGYKPGQKPDDSKYPHGTEEYPEGATGRPDDRYPEGATGRPDEKYPDGQQPVDEFGRPIDKDQHPEKYKPGYKPGQKPGDSKYPHGTEEYPEGATGRPDDRYPEGATGRPDEKYPDGQEPVDEFGRPIDKDQHPQKYKPGQKPGDSKYPHGTEEYPEGATGRPDDRYPEGATGRPDEKYPDGQQPVDEFGKPIDKDQHPEKYKPGYKPGQKPDDSKYPHGTEEYPEGSTGRPGDRYPEGATGRPDEKYPDGQQPVDEFGRPIDKDQHPEKYKPGYKPEQKPGDSKYPHGTEEYPEGATGRPDEKYPDGQEPVDEFGRPIDKDQHPEKYKPGYKPGQKPGDSKYPHGTEEYPEGATGRPDDRYPEGATGRPDEKYPDGQQPVDEFGRPIDKDQHPEKYKPGYKPGQKPDDSKYPHGTEEYPEGATGRPDDRYPEGATGRPDEKYPDGQQPVDEFGRPIDKDQHPEKYQPGYKPGQKPDDSKYPHGTEEYPEGATGRPDDRYPEGATGRPDEKYPDGQQPVDEFGRPIDKDQLPEKYKPGYKPGQKPDDSKYPHGTEEYPEGATGRPDDRYPEGATGRPDEKYPDGQQPVDEFGRPIDKDQHPEKYQPGYKPGQKPDDSKYPHGTEEYPEGATGRPDDRYPEGATGRPHEKYPNGQQPVDEFGRPIDKDQHPEKYKPGQKPGDSKYPHGTEEYPEGATGRPDEKYPDGQQPVDEFGRPIDKYQDPEKYEPGYKPGQKPGDSKYPHGTEEYPEGATGRPDDRYPEGATGRPHEKYPNGQQPEILNIHTELKSTLKELLEDPDEKYPDGQQPVDEFGRPIDKYQDPEKYEPGYKPGQKPGDSKYPHGTEEYPEGATGRPDDRYPEGATGRPDGKYPDGQQPVDKFGKPIDKDQHPEKYKPGYKPGQKPGDSIYPHGTEEYPEGATGRPDDRYPEGATGRPDEKYPDGDSKYPHGTEEYPEGATGRPDDRYPEGATGRPDEKYPDGQQPVDEFGKPIDKDQHPEKYKPGYKPGQKPGDSKYPHGTEEYPEGATGRPDGKYPDGQQPVDKFGKPIDKDQHPEKYKPGYKPGQKPGDSIYPHATEEYPEGGTGRPDEKYPEINTAKPADKYDYITTVPSVTGELDSSTPNSDDLINKLHNIINGIQSNEDVTTPLSTHSLYEGVGTVTSHPKPMLHETTTKDPVESSTNRPLHVVYPTYYPEGIIIRKPSIGPDDLNKVTVTPENAGMESSTNSENETPTFGTEKVSSGVGMPEYPIKNIDDSYTSTDELTHRPIGEPDSEKDTSGYTVFDIQTEISSESSTTHPSIIVQEVHTEVHSERPTMKPSHIHGTESDVKEGTTNLHHVPFESTAYRPMPNEFGTTPEGQTSRPVFVTDQTSKDQATVRPSATELPSYFVTKLGEEYPTESQTSFDPFRSTTIRPSIYEEETFKPGQHYPGQFKPTKEPDSFVFNNEDDDVTQKPFHVRPQAGTEGVFTGAPFTNEPTFEFAFSSTPNYVFVTDGFEEETEKPTYNIAPVPFKIINGTKVYYPEKSNPEKPVEDDTDYDGYDYVPYDIVNGTKVLYPQLVSTTQQPTTTPHRLGMYVPYKIINGSKVYYTEDKPTPEDYDGLDYVPFEIVDGKKVFHPEWMPSSTTTTTTSKPVRKPAMYVPYKLVNGTKVFHPKDAQYHPHNIPKEYDGFELIPYDVVDGNKVFYPDKAASTTEKPTLKALYVPYKVVNGTKVYYPKDAAEKPLENIGDYDGFDLVPYETVDGKKVFHPELIKSTPRPIEVPMAYLPFKVVDGSKIYYPKDNTKKPETLPEEYDGYDLVPFQEIDGEKYFYPENNEEVATEKPHPQGMFVPYKILKGRKVYHLKHARTKPNEIPDGYDGFDFIPYDIIDGKKVYHPERVPQKPLTATYPQTTVPNFDDYTFSYTDDAKPTTDMPSIYVPFKLVNGSKVFYPKDAQNQPYLLPDGYDGFEYVPYEDVNGTKVFHPEKVKPIKPQALYVPYKIVNGSKVYYPNDATEKPRPTTPPGYDGVDLVPYEIKNGIQVFYPNRVKPSGDTPTSMYVPFKLINGTKVYNPEHAKYQPQFIPHGYDGFDYLPYEVENDTKVFYPDRVTTTPTHSPQGMYVPYKLVNGTKVYYPKEAQTRPQPLSDEYHGLDYIPYDVINGTKIFRPEQVTTKPGRPAMYVPFKVINGTKVYYPKRAQENPHKIPAGYDGFDYIPYDEVNGQKVFHPEQGFMPVTKPPALLPALFVPYKIVNNTKVFYPKDAHDRPHLIPQGYDGFEYIPYEEVDGKKIFKPEQAIRPLTVRPMLNQALYVPYKIINGTKVYYPKHAQEKPDKVPVQDYDGFDYVPYEEVDGKKVFHPEQTIPTVTTPPSFTQALYVPYKIINGTKVFYPKDAQQYPINIPRGYDGFEYIPYEVVDGKKVFHPEQAIRPVTTPNPYRQGLYVPYKKVNGTKVYYPKYAKEQLQKLPEGFDGLDYVPYDVIDGKKVFHPEQAVAPVTLPTPTNLPSLYVPYKVINGTKVFYPTDAKQKPFQIPQEYEGYENIPYEVVNGQKVFKPELALKPTTTEPPFSQAAYVPYKIQNGTKVYYPKHAQSLPQYVPQGYDGFDYVPYDIVNGTKVFHLEKAVKPVTAKQPLHYLCVPYKLVNGAKVFHPNDAKPHPQQIPPGYDGFDYMPYDVVDGKKVFYPELATTPPPTVVPLLHGTFVPFKLSNGTKVFHPVDAHEETQPVPQGYDGSDYVPYEAVNGSKVFYPELISVPVDGVPGVYIPFRLSNGKKIFMPEAASTNYPKGGVAKPYDGIAYVPYKSGTDRTVKPATGGNSQIIYVDDKDEILKPHGRPQQSTGVPGEGSCLLNNRTYANNTDIPAFNPCQSRCRCVSSIVQCVRVECPAPPQDAKLSCSPVYREGSCCPTYACDEGTQTPGHLDDDKKPSHGANPADSNDSQKLGKPKPDQQESAEPFDHVEGVLPSDLMPDDDYDNDDEEPYGPGTCRYAGKVYVSAQQIPRDDPCDFCFCFRSDIICLQQSCPPPIPGCRDEPIQGFCCPRYECHVKMATVLNVTSTTTTTTTTLPPHFFSHAYKGSAVRTGCFVQGKAYKVGQPIPSASGPCMDCNCGGDGRMKCEPKVCTPEPMIRKMIIPSKEDDTTTVSPFVSYRKR